MQHEGDKMKVASYPQSSRLLVARGSREKIFPDIYKNGEM